MTLGNENTPLEVSEIVRLGTQHFSFDGSGNITVSNGDLLDGGSNVIYDQSAGHIPSSIVQTAGLDADTVDGFDSADLRNSSNVLQLTSTNTTLDINQSTWTDIPFDVQDILDGAYTHDASGSPESITFDEAGKYRVTVSLSYDANGNTRINPGIKFNVNGTRLETQGLTGYVRASSGHDEGSNTLSRVIEVTAGDTLKIQTLEQGNSGTVTMRANESILTIEQLSASASLVSDADTLDGLDSTAFVKTDGSTPITSQQNINQANNNSFFEFLNTSSSDQWDFVIFGNDDLGFRLNGSSIFTVGDNSESVTFFSRTFFDAGIDAGSSSIDNAIEVNTPGGGSDSFTVYDSANAQDIARFDEGGNVEIPNGSLVISDEFGGISGRRDEFPIRTNGADGSAFVGLYDDFNKDWILQGYEGGDVSIPNGLLTVGNDDEVTLGSSYNLEGNTNTSYIQFKDGTSPRYTIASANSQGGELVFYSDAAGFETLRLKDNNNVDIQNGKLTLTGDDGGVTIDGSSAPSKMLWSGQSAGIGIEVDAGSVNISGSDGGEYSLRVSNKDIWLDSDDTSINIGQNKDFNVFYESSSDELVINDLNGVELIRQPKAGPTQFLQGIDAGSIEAPEDSFTQLVNGSVTSALTTGQRVGYTFALDNQTFLAIDGEADGAGGIQNTTVEIPNGDVVVSDSIRISDRGISSGNDQYNANWIQTDSSGNNSWVFRDSANSQDIARFNEGGDVEIPNGDILFDPSVSGRNFRIGMAGTTDDTIIERAGDDGNGNSFLSIGSALTDRGGPTDILALNANTQVTIGRDNELIVNDSGLVEVTNLKGSTDAFKIPNGGYFLNGDDNPVFGLASNQHILMWDSSARFETFGGGAGSVGFYDGANAQDILVANEGGDVEIPNGDLDISGNALSNASTISASSSLFSIVSDGGGSSRITLFDGANIQAILEAKEGGNVDIPNGNLTVTGNVTVEDNTFQISNSTSGDDFKIFPTGDDFEFRTFDSSVGSAVRFFQLDASNSRMEMFNGIDMGGNTLTSVGGTTDASSGAIRMANAVDISARNVGDTADIDLIRAGDGDDVEIGNNGNHDRIVLTQGTVPSVSIDGNALTNVGGTPDANSGAIRLANNTSINARNAGDTGDFGISFTANDSIAVDTDFNLIDNSLQNVGAVNANIATFSIKNFATGGETIIRSSDNTSTAIFDDNNGVEIPNGDLSFGTAGTISASSGATSMAIDPGSVVFDAGGSTVMTLTNVELTLSEPVVTTSDVEVGGRLDLSAGALMSLPQVGGDPPANAGDMWYRTDLD